MREPVRKVHDDRLREAQGTPGMTRRVAIEADGHWFGHVEAAPETMSGWHHHGDNVTTGATRPFLRPVRLSGELLVRGHDRVGTGRVVTPVRVGVRATIGLHEAIFVPIVFPQSGRSLSLWSLASSSESEAEAWVSRIFGDRDVVPDEELHG